MGSENRIQKLNRELREIADNTRRERQEFQEYTNRTHRRRPGFGRPMANDGGMRVGRKQ